MTASVTSTSRVFPTWLTSFFSSHPPAEVERRRPWGLEWRASVWFITLVVGLGITTDLIVYSIVIPVFPFELEKKGYSNVSALVGYLLFAYSGGLVFSTPPIAWYSERYNTRQMPLLLGLISLIGSQIMLMEAPSYWVMACARVIQGISSSMVWVVALALLCDATPEEYVGRQLGLAMSGLPLGLLIGPPVGGALYSKLGFRAPFIFGIIVTFADVVGRLLIIEPRVARTWGFDPSLSIVPSDEEKPTDGGGAAVLPDEKDKIESEGVQEQPSAVASDHATSPGAGASDDQATTIVEQAIAAAGTFKQISLMQVMIKLMKSPRAVVTIANILIYGITYSSQETVIPLHLQRVWGLDSSKAGLVFIAAVVPVLFSSPLAGWLSDSHGAEWITFACLVMSLPWWGIVIIEGKLALFIVAYAIESFFTAAVVAPLTRELAIVSTKLEGVGYAHAYGAYNLAYGLGSCVGPIIGGQIFQHVSRGWMGLSVLAIGLLTLAITLSFVWTGDRPLLSRFMTLFRDRKAAEPGAAVDMKDVQEPIAESTEEPSRSDPSL
ncbi:MFS general substrate transporter [Dentipellis sp. KUC8613]|nr:MFS general substrate transporter [Dentipellis sp. KUC8613]